MFSTKKVVRHSVRAVWLAAIWIANAVAANSTAQDGLPELLRLSAAPVMSLDGVWWLAVDPGNIGRDESWFQAPRPEAKPVKVPWIIQDVFPAYHGVAWYWRDFIPPANPHPRGRSLLRFWGVDFSGEIWLNGIPVGRHEGGETPFVLDVTDILKTEATNRLSVRVLNPTHQPIDGLRLNQTPRQARVIPYSAGAAYNCGGITESVELLHTPSVRLDDLRAVPDPKTGVIHLEAGVHNASAAPVHSRLEFAVAAAAGGENLREDRLERDLPPGDSLVQAELKISQPHLWDINDPFLYRVAARLDTGNPGGADERSTRCGFRDFRFENGYFRLNGRRIFLRSSHTCNHFPIGQRLPHDPDLARRDLLDVKVMGFNTIRFIWGGAERYQLDLCDEIGLMVYEESFASMSLDDSPKMKELFDSSVGGLIRRDRNHASLVIWGLLNESGNTPAFQHAVEMLPLVRTLDDSRLVFLNAGRFDGLGSDAGGPFSKVNIWRGPSAREPWVVLNPTEESIETPYGFSWPPHEVCLHPGGKGEYSVARWTSPQSGAGTVTARFTGLPKPPATTDVHVLHNGQPLFDSMINLGGHPNSASFSGRISLAKGDTIDFAVGWGNGSHGGDTTVLAAGIRLDSGPAYDVARDFSESKNPGGAWGYGIFSPGPAPVAATFAQYALNKNTTVIGSVANPRSAHWEDLVIDTHNYPRVPHTAATIHMLRSLSGSTPVFLSEYGIGSAVDLWRVTRQFEQLGRADAEDALFYKDKLNRYLADWRRWKMDDLYARPEDFFAESIRRMAGQRALGLNAIRSNPNIVGYSLTGMNDHVSCGEGLTTTFRELKPGTVDAMFEGFAPLRWCLFAEPVNVYRGSTVHLEAVLANEDALPAGECHALVQVIGPNNLRILERNIVIHLQAKKPGMEAPLTIPVFDEELPVDGPAGKYRLLATLENDGAPTCGETTFYLDDPATMPPIQNEIVVWGEDPPVEKWLAAHQIKTRRFSEDGFSGREVILAGTHPPNDAAKGFISLARHVARGSTAVFLTPEIFKKGAQNTGWLPMEKKGSLNIVYGWLYLKDEWAKRHPIFEGLPSAGLMDYIFYREIIPDALFTGLDAPEEAVAGAIKASQDYTSGLMLAIYPFGSGRCVLNTFLIRENLGVHPVAERLLRNLLRYAARDQDKPLADAPADFEAQLKLIGYE